MKKEKATNLCEFLNTAIKYCEYAVLQKEAELPNSARIKSSLTEETFHKLHSEFMDELASNILEYRDVEIAYTYFYDSLNTFRNWYRIDSVDNRKILAGNYEVEFLLKLKLNIEKEIGSIRVLFNDHFMSDSRFRAFFNEVISKDEYEKRKAKTPVKDENKPAFDERFDFDKMMQECLSVATHTTQKIEFIQNRIYDLKQWQLRYDVEDNFKITFSKNESKYKYTLEYYPKFEELCKLELQRLNKKLELEKKALTHKALENNPIIIQNGETKSIYSWKSTGTDLLELVSALHKNDSIQRKDGKTLTRKELTEYFQHLFGVEIKDVEGTLTRATNRKTNMTPFLDRLKTAFENYAEEKLEKQSKR